MRIKAHWLPIKRWLLRSNKPSGPSKNTLKLIDLPAGLALVASAFAAAEKLIDALCASQFELAFAEIEAVNEQTLGSVVEHKDSLFVFACASGHEREVVSRDDLSSFGGAGEAMGCIR